MVLPYPNSVQVLGMEQPREGAQNWIIKGGGGVWGGGKTQLLIILILVLKKLIRGPIQIQIVRGTFFSLDLDIFQGGGEFDTNPKTFEALFCHNLDIIYIFPEIF